MLASLLSLLTLAAILLAAYGAGRPLVRALRLEMEDHWAQATWSIGLGLVVAGALGMALGVAGCLFRELIAVLTVAAACWGFGRDSASDDSLAGLCFIACSGSNRC